MKLRVLLALAVFLPCLAVRVARTQEPQPQKPEIWIANLSLPTYPPLARQARISGDVRVELRVRQDGTVESAEIIDGHAMLREAALASAKQTKFICQDCAKQGQSYVLTYTFGLRVDAGGADCGIDRSRASKCPRGPVMGESRDRVIILADAACVQP